MTYICINLGNLYKWCTIHCDFFFLKKNIDFALSLFFLIKNRFFSHTIHTDHSYSTLHSSQLPHNSPFLQTRFFSISIKKGAGLEETTIEHNKTRNNNIK